MLFRNFYLPLLTSCLILCMPCRVYMTGKYGCKKTLFLLPVLLYLITFAPLKYGLSDVCQASLAEKCICAGLAQSVEQRIRNA